MEEEKESDRINDSISSARNDRKETTSVPTATNDAPGGSDEEVEDESDDSLMGGDGLGVLTEEEQEILERRRLAEMVLLDKYDKTKIDPRKECWFLISTKWLNQWIEYVTGKTEPPGPISNMDLHVEGTRTLKRNLEPKKDFRGISPTMWYIFVELYNKDGAPELCRYSLNIYDPGVAGRHRERASRGAALKARVEVAKLRESFLPESSSEEEDEQVCCCIHNSHLEFMLFHLFTCCKHLGKSGPRYKSLLQDYDDSDDDMGMLDEDEEDEEEKVERKRWKKEKERARKQKAQYEKRKAKAKEKRARKRDLAQKGGGIIETPPTSGNRSRAASLV